MRMTRYVSDENAKPLQKCRYAAREFGRTMMT